MPDADRVAEILGAWQDARDRGELLDPNEVVRRHPDLADELRAHFAILGVIDQALDRPDMIGDYRIERELGRGGMGVVYLARDEDGRKVALKVIHPHLLERRGFFKRFLREAEIGKRVDHQNVVRTLDADALSAGGRTHHFLVMEYVEGQTLRGLLDELERVPEELCRHIAEEVARALEAIHAVGVIHRDLKPENILITPEHVVKVMDLGVAHLARETARLSQAGQFVGSVLYAAPEQFRGEESDPRADLYALGVVLYEMSTGRHPYAADEPAAVIERLLHEEPRAPAELNPQLSPAFEEVVKTLLAKDRMRRFASARDLLEVLEQGEGSPWWLERAKAIRAETKRPLRRIRIPRETALYGRDDDLALLRSLYEKAGSGEGQVLLIEGEAGIGKTRLVDEFVGQLRQEGEELNFLFGSYPPGGAATAAGAFSTAYREHLGGEDLDGVLREYLKETPLLIPAFSALLRGDGTPTGAEPLTKDSFLTVFVHITRALAAERPTVVLIDDLHNAPDEGRGVFASLVLAVATHRILLVGTNRPGLPEEWVAAVERSERCSRTALGRLGPKDLAQLLVDAFQSERLAQELALPIARKSDGNPFFVFEIIQGLKEGQFLRQAPDGTWVTTQIIRDIQIPSSVMDLIQARLADLSPEDKNLLDLASCGGFEFDPLLVAAAQREDPVPVLQRLARIEKKHRLVRAAGRHFAFDHHQVQEALYAGLPEPLREAYHLALGEALESRECAAESDVSDLGGGLVVDLCKHFLAGTEARRAGRYVKAAIQHFQKGYLNSEAADLARRALGTEGLIEGEERVRVLLSRERSLHVQGHRQEQRQVLDEALALAAELGDPEVIAQVELSLGDLLVAAAAFDDAETLLDRLAREARAAGNRSRELRATANLGQMSLFRGRIDEARAHFERSLDLARSMGDANAQASAEINLGGLFQVQMENEEARQHHERGLELAIRAGNRRWEQNALGNLSVVHMNVGQFEKAIEYNERCLQISQAIGDRPTHARSMAVHAGILGAAGRLEESIRLDEAGIKTLRELGDPLGLSWTLHSKGKALQDLGRWTEAMEPLEESRDIAQAIGAPRAEVHPQGYLGRGWWRLGQYGKAHACWSRLCEVASSFPAALESGRASLAMLFIGLGDSERAAQLLEDVAASGRRRKARDTEATVLRLRGSIAEQAGQHAEALRLLEQALETVPHKTTDDLTFEVDTLMELGRSLSILGRTEEAETRFKSAATLAKELHLAHDVVLAEAHRALLPGGDIRAALRTLEELGEASGPAANMEARFLIWKATGERDQLAEANRQLCYLRDHAPEEYRDSMIENVPLYRDVMRAWEEHGTRVS